MSRTDGRAVWPLPERLPFRALVLRCQGFWRRQVRADDESLTIIEEHPPMPKKLDIVASLPPLHPGEVSREEFLKPMGLPRGQAPPSRARTAR